MTSTNDRDPADRPRVGPARVGPTGTDILVAIAVMAFGVIALASQLGRGDASSPLPYLIAVLAGASLVWRRRFPLAVLAVTLAGRLLVIWEIDNELALLPAAAVALYTVTRYRRTWIDVTAASLGALVMGLTAAGLGDDAFRLEFIGELAQALLPIAVAEVLRSRADRLRDLVETESEARVQAERLRIARDLHDVVAHSLSIITIQSGVAAHLLERRPSQAKEALEIINSTGQTTLGELRTMVGVLRSSDGGARYPTPSDPNDIRDVLGSARQAGVEVTLETTGSFPPDVGNATVVAVHRIVQEALTNVARHAIGAPAVIRLIHGEGEVEVEVRNEPPDGRQPGVASTGVGIVGMRERAESLGGSLDAGPTVDGGFRVLAIVPYHRRSP